MAALDLTVTGNALFPFRPPFLGDLSDCVVFRDPDRPWLAEIVEPLLTDAPENASPWCCYLQTVIFYEQPWRKCRGEFAKHDQIETRLAGDDIVLIDREKFRLFGGKVRWSDGRWVMTNSARRLH